jgi:DNA-binding transcriptional regulator LsrR (DeoR family)
MNTEFAQRLAYMLDQRGLSQSQLAHLLGISRSTVTGWLRYRKLPDAGLLALLCDKLNCSADELLGLRAHSEKQDTFGTIRWIESIPPYIHGFQREQIEYGVRLFRQFVVENQSAAEVHNAYNAVSIRSAMQAAFRSGAVRLLSVSRDEILEAQIKGRYPFLKDVVVASVPGNYDDTLIRVELVAFLAATQVLSQVIREGAVGLGSGYTLLRMCEYSLPSVDQFSGTRWIPLLAFQPDNTSDYTANFLAQFMSIRHPGSQALYLPHPAELTLPNIAAVQQETLRWMGNMQTMFVSVSGIDRREQADTGHLLSEFRSADYAAEAAYLRGEYARLDDKGRFGAELLRYLLDTDGRIISRDPAVGAHVDLDILRYNSDVMGKVCIVAARRYKAKAVLTCLHARLANALVIDSEIAHIMLEAE